MCVAFRRFLALLMFSIPPAGGVLSAEEEGARALNNSVASVESKPAIVTSNSTEKREKQTKDIDDLDYPGRDMDSEWRKEATERIDQHRKAELTVLVTDARGKPIREADVSIRLKQHAFRFGTVVSVEFSPAIVAAPLSENGSEAEDGGNGVPAAARTPRAEMPAGHQFENEDRAIYREKLFSLFNTASPRGGSLDADRPMTTWLRSRGFLFDAEPVQEKVVPAAFTIENLKPPEELLSDLKKLNGETDLPLVARRYSLAVDPENLDQLQLQADYTRDFFTALFSIPGTREISIDGFWAPVSGVDSWALFAEDWSIRPVGRIYADLVKRVWSTNEEGLTDGAGKVKFRGFIGLYRVSVVVGTRMKTISAVLPKGGAEIKIQID